MNQYSDLDEISRDFLRELGNIGTGNAVTSLSHMLMEPVDIEVPGLQIMKYQDCCSLLPEGRGRSFHRRELLPWVKIRRASACCTRFEIC